MQRTFVVLYAAAFLDLCGVGMITMQLPNHLRQLGASHTTVGYIGSLYGFVQLLSSPLVGGYADRHSKRLTLLFSISVCTLGYFLLGFVSNLWVIASLRIYLGVFKHPLNLIKSALSDLTKGQSAQNESEALGYYQSACGLAFIVCPPIAGYLMQTENGYSKIGICVSCIYMVNAVMIYMYLPKDKPSDVHLMGQQSVSNSNGETASNNTKHTGKADPSDMDQVSLYLLFTSKFLMGINGHLWRLGRSLLFKELFHLTPLQIGWLVSFNGLVQTLIGSRMKYVSMVLTSRYHQLLASCIVSALSMAIISNVSELTGVYIVIACMSSSTMVGKVSEQSFTSLVLGKEHSGYLVGVSGTVMSAARLVTPVFAGYLFEYYGVKIALYVASFCIVIATCLYTIVNQRHVHKLKYE